MSFCGLRAHFLVSLNNTPLYRKLFTEAAALWVPLRLAGTLPVEGSLKRLGRLLQRGEEGASLSGSAVFSSCSSGVWWR